jgi:catechol 2,3-dioxygenase-like lactoylglutathione lyase family enzyme
MKIEAVSGFAVIAKDPEPSRALYRDVLGFPFREKDGYLHVDRFPGANHFGVWTLAEAAQSCFGIGVWPTDLPVPQATIEFELSDIEAVEAAVEEMKAAGQRYVHGAREEPWGQTIARFISPEGLLIGLSYAPWLHENR